MVWNAALVFSYGLPFPGRENAALTNFADAHTFFGKLAADGKCAEPEIFHHGYGGGMIIVKAETPEMLHEILLMDETRRLIAVTSFTTAGFKYEMYHTGEFLMDSMARYSAVGAELGYL